MDRKRDIFIKVERIREIAELVDKIKKDEDDLRRLFERYDKLNLEENKVFENWSGYIEDIEQKLEHVTL